MPIGVDRFDGSSDVKMVAEDGDIRYLVFSVASKASLNPKKSQHISLLLWECLTSNFTTIANNDKGIPKLTPFANFH